jgi:phage baseplate assembly protein W
MAKEFLGRGWKFPLSMDADGQIAVSEYEEDIREAIGIILGTSKGERVMRPDFGCGIHDFVFEVLNTSTQTLITNSVKDALTQWEPRIQLIEVKVSTENINEGKLMINIDYKVRSTNNSFNLVYPFYLGGGG